MAEPAGAVALSEALDALREGLERFWAESEGRDLRIRVDDVTLTLQVVARREKEGGGKVRWWVIEAGADVKTGSETMQTLVLKLTPESTVS
jgi:NTP-dependent ternary system trypsin peptidase co-occuring protein